MRPASKAAAAFVAAHEQLRLEAYRDPGGAYTAGYGHTGPEVHAALRIQPRQAEAWLEADLETAAVRLAGVVAEAVLGELTENQHVALISFVFNLGADPKWTIWKRLNARQFDQVPVEMMRFVYVGRTKLQGLVNRRAAEVALWSTAEPGSAPDEPPSSYTRAEATPPAAADPTPIHRQPQFLTVAGAAVLGAPKAIEKVSGVVAPYADKSRYVQTAVETLATLGAASAAAAVVVLWLQSRQAKR